MISYLASSVLQFLQEMAQGEEPDNTPPRSMVDPDEYERPESIRNGAQMYSPVPKSKASDTLLNTGMAGVFSPKKDFKANSFVEEVNGDDVNSNAQDGVRSELGEMKAVRCNSGCRRPLRFSDSSAAGTGTRRSSTPQVCLL
jgi:hypothetical protein